MLEIETGCLCDILCKAFDALLLRIALVDDEATLKRYYLDNERQQVRLHPENDKYEDMYFDNIIIQGVAVKVIADVK